MQGGDQRTWRGAGDPSLNQGGLHVRTLISTSVLLCYFPISHSLYLLPLLYAFQLIQVFVRAMLVTGPCAPDLAGAAQTE